jgi:hypothetical protein
MLSMSFDAGPNLFRGVVRLAAEAPPPEPAPVAAQAN